jgi:hypothetical protein
MSLSTPDGNGRLRNVEPSAEPAVLTPSQARFPAVAMHTVNVFYPEPVACAARTLDMIPQAFRLSQPIKETLHSWKFKLASSDRS